MWLILIFFNLVSYLNSEKPFIILVALFCTLSLQMKTLFHGWPVMAHETHTRKKDCFVCGILWSFLLWYIAYNAFLMTVNNCLQWWCYNYNYFFPLLCCLFSQFMQFRLSYSNSSFSWHNTFTSAMSPKFWGRSFAKALFPQINRRRNIRGLWSTYTDNHRIRH